MAKNAIASRSSGSKTPGEMFDLNAVSITGKAIGLWGRNGDVFVRLQIKPQLPLPASDCLVNVCISNGMLDGNLVTLQKGDLLQVAGYVRQTNFTESIRNFLDDAGRIDFLDRNVPPDDIPAWRNIRFKRRNALVEATGIKILAEIGELVNTVDLEGVITETWAFRRDEMTDVFARVAVYDEFTLQTAKDGKWGRKRRIAHYVNVLFPEGKPLSADRPVRLDKRQRIRVRGELRDKWNTVSFHELLMGTGDSKVIDLLQNVYDKDKLHAIKTQQESLHVLADAAVLYSR
ncbi:MAG: hypothetical protein QY332_10320 [Anaerolineales bacterium]|nr:MAG: hypothetical protein QY332_10320 [Anaerolineales bacterium]